MPHTVNHYSTNVRLGSQNNLQIAQQFINCCAIYQFTKCAAQFINCANSQIGRTQNNP